MTKKCYASFKNSSKSFEKCFRSSGKGTILGVLKTILRASRTVIIGVMGII